MNPVQKRSFWALMVTQFFGAFNDNVFKTLVTLMILQWVADPNDAKNWVDLSGAVFVAPFLIFSMFAGRLSDRFSKTRVIVATKYWELIVVAAAVSSLWLESVEFMMTTLFLLAMQAAFFSPAKYGVLPEMMQENELPTSNGWINMLTFLAIILGTISGAFLSENLVVACVLMVAASLIGVVSSYFIEALPAAKPDQPMAWNPFKELARNWQLMKADPSLKLGGIAVNYFWFMGAVLQLNIFIYAKEMMAASDKASGVLLIAVLAGIALGSFLAGRLSQGRVEMGFVPLGALGMGIFAVDLLWSYHSLPRLLLDLFMLGLSGGFYDIPLMALLQAKSPYGERGRVMATINFFSFIAILCASGVLWFMHAILNLDSAHVFFFLGVLSVIAILFVCVVFPEAPHRSLQLFRRPR